MNTWKKTIYRETKEILKIAVGAIMLGGIIKQDWLMNNWFVWLFFVFLIMFIFVLSKSE